LLRARARRICGALSNQSLKLRAAAAATVVRKNVLARGRLAVNNQPL
jgi:hypothetical protein